MRNPICKFDLYDIISELNTDEFYLFDKTVVYELFKNNEKVKNWFSRYYYVSTDDDLPTSALDKYIKQHYGGFYPIIFDDDITTNDPYWYALHIRSRVVSPFLVAHADSISRYIELFDVDYNPIDNYDKTSTITTEKQGTETNTDNFGQDKTTNVVGGKTTTETGKNAPYETNSDFVNDTKTEVSESGNTDTSTTDAKTDSHTLTFTERKDIVTERTRGNIGVTTSAQMLQGDTEFWGVYNIINYVMKMFIAECCVLIDD